MRILVHIGLLLLVLTGEMTADLQASPYNLGAQLRNARRFKVQKLADDNVISNFRDLMSRFGHTTALSADGNTLVIGAPYEGYDYSGGEYSNFAGAVYIYTRSGGVWSLQQKLSAPTAAVRDPSGYYGWTVGVSGDTVIVGAYGASYDGAGTNYVLSSGAAYVYTRTAGVWSLQQKLIGSGTNGRVAYDYFGQSVAIDGDTAIVGAYAQDYDENGANAVTNAGAAYVFTRSGGVWSLQQKIVASGPNARQESGYFGYSVQVQGDTAAIGAHYEDLDENGLNTVYEAGAVYVFKRNTGVWSLEQKLVGQGTNGRVSGDYFGSKIALDTDTLAVGAYSQDYDANGGGVVGNAGAVYVYTRSGSSWSLQQKIVPTGTNARDPYDYFGYALSLSGDSLAVGSYGQAYDENGANSIVDAGAAFVFTRSGAVWSQQQRIVPSGTNARNTSDLFGHSVAVSGDTLAIGAPYHGYDSAGGQYASQNGGAWVWTRSGSTWSIQQRLAQSATYTSRGTYDMYGFDTALSEDGNTLVVGAIHHDWDENNQNGRLSAGAAYVYVKSGGNWVLQQKLVATGAGGRRELDYFGYAVDISGETIVVGAYNHALDSGGAGSVSGAGAAYVFTRSGGVWTLQQKLSATGTNARMGADYFGYDVAIDGDTLAVSAYGQDYDQNGANPVNAAGAVYVFKRNAGTWSQEQKVVAQDTNGRMAEDYFGIALDISGDTLAVGAYLQDYDASGGSAMTNAGAVWVYTRSGSVWSLQQRLVSGDRAANDQYGRRVSIDGDTLVVGAPYADLDATGANPVGEAGAVYIYTRSGGVWSQQQKLVGQGTQARRASDYFGMNIDLDGNRLVVGAPYHDYDASGRNSVTNAGALFVYVRNGASWYLENKITPLGTNARTSYSYLAQGVAVAGTTMALGAYLHCWDTNGANCTIYKGAAWVYEPQ